MKGFFSSSAAKGRILLNKLYDLIYPRHCIGCADFLRHPEPFCSNCLKTLRRITGPVCALCGIPFVSEAATSHSPDQRCGDCRHDPPCFSKAITPFFYEGPLAEGIRRFKYQRQTGLADFFAQQLMDDLSFARGAAYRIIPIPLHPDRLRSREFNQSLLLAAKMAGALSQPYAPDALIRIRPTPPQVGLHQKERKANLAGAFRVSRPEAVQNERILLVDDVYTTGATLKEGAATLMRAGAQEVIAVAIARMVPEMQDKSTGGGSP